MGTVLERRGAEGRGEQGGSPENGKGLSFLARLDSYPPCLLRLYAHKGHGINTRALSNREISSRSGLNQRTVARLSTSMSWSGFQVQVASAYMRACGFDLFHLRRFNEFFRQSHLMHARRTRYLSGLIRKASHGD